MESTRAGAAFHASVRWAQCGDYVTMEEILRSLSSHYGTNVEIASSESPLHLLTGDTLAYVFSFLTLTERNNVRLVCKKWLARSFSLGDQRSFCARGVPLEEMRQFFLANLSLTRIGHISPSNALELFSSTSFMCYRISSLTLVESHRLDSEAVVNVLRLLPRLEVLSLKLSMPLSNMFACPASLRSLEIVGITPGAKVREISSNTLETLKIDDGVSRDLRSLLLAFPALRNLTTHLFAVSQTLPANNLTKLDLLNDIERRFDPDAEKLDLSMTPLVWLSACLGRESVGLLPGTLRFLKLKEGSPLTKEIEFPEDLEGLDVMDLSSAAAVVEVFVKQGKFARLKELRGPVPSTVAHTLINLQCLALNGRRHEEKALKLPPQLRQLELCNFRDFNFEAIADCQDLRRLIIRESHCSKPLWQVLPKNLFQISILDLNYELRWPAMSVDDWIRLPVFCATIPRLDSVLEGLIQFQ
jgi:hypothetical protein